MPKRITADRRCKVQISLRIPSETNAKLQNMAARSGRTKTALIIDAVNEKYHIKKKRTELIRELAGWMSPEECAELRNAVADFNAINDGDWP